MATARSQKNSKLHDNTPGKHKLRKIYLWNPTTIRLIMETLIHVISMEFCRDVYSQARKTMETVVTFVESKGVCDRGEYPGKGW